MTGILDIDTLFEHHVSEEYAVIYEGMRRAASILLKNPDVVGGYSVRRDGKEDVVTIDLPPISIRGRRFYNLVAAINKSGRVEVHDVMVHAKERDDVHPHVGGSGLFCGDYSIVNKKMRDGKYVGALADILRITSSLDITNPYRINAGLFQCHKCKETNTYTLEGTGYTRVCRECSIEVCRNCAMICEHCGSLICEDCGEEAIRRNGYWYCEGCADGGSYDDEGLDGWICDGCEHEYHDDDYYNHCNVCGRSFCDDCILNCLWCEEAFCNVHMANGLYCLGCNPSGDYASCRNRECNNPGEIPVEEMSTEVEGVCRDCESDYCVATEGDQE